MEPSSKPNTWVGPCQESECMNVNEANSVCQDQVVWLSVFSFLPLQKNGVMFIKLVSYLNYHWKLLTLTLASVRFVHMAISSLVDMSGYRFLAKVASSSWSCWEVKWVLCLRCLLFFLSFFSPSSPPPPSSPPKPGVVDSVLIVVSEFKERFPAKISLYQYFVAGCSIIFIKVLYIYEQIHFIRYDCHQKST